MAKPLLLAVADIQQYYCARKLSENEIKTFETAIENFFDLLKPYPTILNKNKMHAVKFHVVPFVKKFKSWELYSEQCE